MTSTQRKQDKAAKHEAVRQQVWINAWTSVAGAMITICREDSICTKWADAALKAFDERFKNNNQ